MKTYNFPLIKGSFSKEEALTILTNMVEAKIKYHEGKILMTSNEEDIKMRENRIKQLQKDLYEVRNYLDHRTGRVELNSEIVLQ